MWPKSAFSGCFENRFLLNTFKEMTCVRGNVPEALIAFIVDQYLYRNQFSQTRAIFRNEASTLFVDSPPNKNLLSLEGIVDQYIFTKNQNILLNKQNAMLMQEKHKLQMLLQDLQNVLDSFHARSSSLSNAQAIIQNSTVLLNRNLSTTPMQNSNTNIPVMSTSTNLPMQNTLSVTPAIMDNINLSLPMINLFHPKRKDNPTIDDCKVAKKQRGRVRKNQIQGINTLLPSPSNEVDFGFSSVTTQSLVENYALSGSQISIDSVSRTLPNSSQCDTHLPLSSHISQPTDISPAAAGNGEATIPCSDVISTNRVMVQPVNQTLYKEDINVISPIEPYSDQTNKEDVNQTSTGTLDKPFVNEILTSEPDMDRDIWANLDFSNIGLDDWSKIDFSNIEGDNSSTNGEF